MLQLQRAFPACQAFAHSYVRSKEAWLAKAGASPTDSHKASAVGLVGSKYGFRFRV